ncbi:hypothetical protein R9X49_20430 [Pectobacterium carotovorum]|uniref:hypothetical protein n=1 Tax=Pectobacterium carotovorum TaxID=554 RepID=UPI0029DDA50D|nr:hypothetical protein [Pectobacterium carotovorum]MDX6917479.1 hypothetical protein [Pectobacterium carotovorum]
MPTVPVVRGPQVSSRGIPAAPNNQQFTPDDFGAGFAKVGQDYVQAVAEAHGRANLAQAQEGEVEYQEFANNRLNNPNDGLYTKQGKDAMPHGIATIASIKAKGEEILGRVPAGPMRDKLALQVRRMDMQYETQIRSYERDQTQKFQYGQFQGTLDLDIDELSKTDSSNPAWVGRFKSMTENIKTFGFAHGWSDEQIQAKLTEAKKAAAKQNVENQLGAGQVAEFLQRNGEPSDAGGVAHVPSSAGPVRGLRNNNPGNIVQSANTWEGQTGSDGQYATFATPEHGIRALGKNLLSYSRQGYQTIDQIINRWAPPSENNTGAYVSAVSKAMGIPANTPVDLTDPATLTRMATAITQHENGSMPYTQEQVNSGIQAALGISTLPDTGRRVTKSTAFSLLDPSDQGRYIRQAMTMENQQRAEYRAQLTDVVQDATASYLKGVEYPNAPTEGKFIQAYGYREGRQRYEDFSNMRVAGQYIGSFRNMPTASINQYVADLKGQLGEGEGFAGRAAAFDHVQAAANRVISLRESDPYQAAVDMGAFKPIVSNNPNDITAEVKIRFANSDKLKALGINAPLLSKQEAAGLSEMVRGSTNVDQSVNLLQAFGRSLPPQALRSITGSIAPNSAATAYASLLLAPEDNQYNNRQPTIAYSQFIKYKPTMDKYEAAKTILLGDQLINPTEAQKKAGMQPVMLPSDDKLREAFDLAVGNAFQYNPQAHQMAYSVFKSAYAGLAYSSGKESDMSTKAVTSNLSDQAVQYATGGVYKSFNGGDVVMPFGMDKSTFKDRFHGAARGVFSEAGLNPGAVGNFRPVNVGDNQYRLVAGSGRWALNPRTGDYIVVRVQ